MARLLYEKHIPADPMLAESFADMPQDQPGRLAEWLAGALGGPATGAQHGDLREDLHEAGFALAAGEFAEEHRARWVALAAVAADEAGLPAEAGFRSALVSCLEWGSRTAVAQEPPGDAAPAAEAEPADVPLPGPDQPVSFADHIKPLFREQDRQSMSFAFDLGSFDDVRTRAADILQRLRSGSMPCDGPWPADRTAVFQRWIDTGTQP